MLARHFTRAARCMRSATKVTYAFHRLTSPSFNLAFTTQRLTASFPLRFFSTESQDNSAVIQSIEALNTRFDELYVAKSFEDSLEVLRELITLKEANGLDIRHEVQQTGHVLIKLKRTEEGLDVLYDLKSQLESLGIVDPLIIGKIAENASKAEMLRGKLTKAADILQEAIKILEVAVASEQSPENYDILARNYTQLGNILALEKKEKLGYLAEYEKAREIYEKFEELVPEQQRSYAIVLQKMANALINTNEIDMAETHVAKSKQLWMALETNEPVDPSHYSTLITFAVVELYKSRVPQAMKVINQCKLDLEKRIETDKQYSNAYMATITIIAGIFKSNPNAKQALDKVAVDFDKGLKLLEGSDDDGPTKLLLEEYKQIRKQLFE